MSKDYIKIFRLMALTLVSVLFLLAGFSVAAIKFKYITSIYSDDQGIALEQPEGIACDQNILLIVADTGNGRLLQFTFKDGAIQLGTVEIKLDQLLYPMKTEINSRGEIYTLDRKQRRIVRLSPEGKFRGYLNPAGLPSPTTYIPRSFTIDKNDNIYILDILSERVLILDPAGEYLRQIRLPEKYGPFSDLTVDFKGRVLLLDGVNGMVFSAANASEGFSPLRGSLKEYVRFPTSLTTDSRGRIYLVDRNGGSIIILGQDGSFLERQIDMGWKEGRLNYPAQMCISNKGEVFIADTMNHRIQIFAVVE
jgi:hypothetical protein